MDPHMTREDYENLCLEPLTHRHLKQATSPPNSLPNKKKKLVNFKLSLRKDSEDEHMPITYQYMPEDKDSPQTPQEEDVFKTKENEKPRSFRKLGILTKRDDSISSLSTQDTILTPMTPEPNGNVPGWEDIPDNQRPNLNQVTLPTKSALKNPLPTEDVPLQERRMSPTSPWKKVRSSSIDSARKASLFSVVNVVVSKRQGRPPPSIWTPAIPRIQPTPRPGNWREQEEPGKGHYRFSFISNSTLVKSSHSKQQIRQMKYQSSPYYQESQSPKQRKKHMEFMGKHYAQWMSDILRNHSFQEGGYLMKAMETGVQFPVVHMIPVTTNANSKQQREASSSSATTLGLGSEAVVSQGIYEEVVRWTPELLVTCPCDPSQWARCFIVIAYKTLDGELSRAQVENQWREWTGAFHVYFNISDDLHLKRLSFYRRSSRHLQSLFTYIVVIEVDTVTKENCLYLLDFVYRMRLKGMGGYLGVYQEHLRSSPSYPSPSLTVQCESPSTSSGSSSSVSDDSSVLDLTKINI